MGNKVEVAERRAHWILIEESNQAEIIPKRLEEIVTFVYHFDSINIDVSEVSQIELTTLYKETWTINI